MGVRNSGLLSIVAVLVLCGCGDSKGLVPSSVKNPVAGSTTHTGSSSTKEDAPGFKGSDVYVTMVDTPNLEQGTGAEQRLHMLKAVSLQEQRQYAATEKVLDEIIGSFERRMTDTDAVYVSLANRAELVRYQEEQTGKKVVWFDYVFGDALYHKTFLAVVRRDFSEALKLSKRERRFRPYAVDAYVEHGFILNAMGRPKEGLAAYVKALQLGEQFQSNRGQKAMTLRGIGFSRIELNDLNGARAAFEQSLQLEPNNPLALKELQYIAKLEGKIKQDR